MKNFDNAFLSAVYSRKKPTRKEAAAFLKAEALRAFNEGDESLMHDLAYLYHYFAPKASPKALLKRASTDPWSWVQTAVAKKDVRLYLNHMYVCSDTKNYTGKALCGCDGHRLHIVHYADNLPDVDDCGLYMPNERKPVPDPENIGTYPKVKELLPKELLPKRSDLLAECTLGELKTEYAKELIDETVAVYAIVGEHRVPVNREYLEQALAGFNDSAVVGLIDNRVFITSDDKTALIMGVRL